MRKNLQQLMQQNVGITRNDKDLVNSRMELHHWKVILGILEANFVLNTSFFELKNMIEVALLIVEQSIGRTDNRGGFVKVEKQQMTQNMKVLLR